MNNKLNIDEFVIKYNRICKSSIELEFFWSVDSLGNCSFSGFYILGSYLNYKRSFLVNFRRNFYEFVDNNSSSSLFPQNDINIIMHFFKKKNKYKSSEINTNLHYNYKQHIAFRVPIDSPDNLKRFLQHLTSKHLILEKTTTAVNFNYVNDDDLYFNSF